MSPAAQNRIIILSVSIKNFMSFHDVSFDATKFVGVNLILGFNHDVPNLNNGSGKTALWSAVSWCLYGETLHNINTGSISNRKYPDEPVEVTVVLKAVNGKIYTVISRIERKTCASLTVLENGEICDRTGLRETRAHLVKDILNMSYDVFKRRIILINDNSRNFFEMKTLEKRKFVDDNFALDVFAKMYAGIHQDANQCQKDMLTKELRLKQLENTLVDLKENEETFLKQRESRIVEINEQIKLKLNYIQELFDATSENLTTKVKEAHEVFSSKAESLETVNTKISNAQNERIKLEQSVKFYEKQEKQYSEILKKVCAECETMLLKDVLQTDEKKESTELLTKLNSAISKYKELQKILSLEIGSIQQRFMKLQSYKEEYNRLKAKLDEYKTVDSPVATLIEKSKTAIDSEKKSIIDKTNECNYLDFLEFVVSEDGVKRFVVKNIVSLLNQRMQFYLTRLVSTYTCVFDENFNPNFKTETGYCEYNNFSAGERMRLKIASLFAFRDLLFDQALIDFNVLVVDEFFDSALDALAIARILDILKEIAEKTHTTVFIISHRKEIKYTEGIFSSRIFVEKQLGDSTLRIVEGDNNE